jgi:methylglutaconyl-CoA hydratase
MDFTRIAYQSIGRTARITLDRPDRRNAIDDVMIAELATAFAAAVRDPAVRVVLLTGAGDTFCAGADLAYLRTMQGNDLEENRMDSGRLAALFRQIYELRKPVIAVVNGPALAGGCGLAATCDFIIASRERATFGFPEVRIGFIPALVTIFLVKRIGEGRARELILRGHTIPAADAERIGLATAVAAHDELDSAALALAEELASRCGPTAMGLCKELLARLSGLSTHEALEVAGNMNAAARMTAECREGIAAFLEKRPLRW